MVLEVCGSTLTIMLWNKIEQRPESLEVFSGLENWEDQWDNMVLQSEILNFRNLETYVFFNTRRCLPIPSLFFDEAAARQQLDIVYGEAAGLHFGGDVLAQKHIVVAWEVPLSIYHCVTGHFSLLHVRSLAAAIVELGAAQPSQDAHGRLVVNGTCACMAMWRGEQLLLLKTLAVGEPDDLAYQLLLACKQWGIGQDEIQWKVSGMVHAEAPLWRSPDRFFSHFEPASVSAEMGEEIPGHYFAHLVQYMRQVVHA